MPIIEPIIFPLLMFISLLSSIRCLGINARTINTKNENTAIIRQIINM